MFFLLRVAFWLSIVLVLLPSGDYQPKAAAPSIGAADAIGAATAAVSDMSGFCQRQPEACEVGGQAAVALGQRAQAGARLLFDVIQDKMAPAQTGSVKGKLPELAGYADAKPTARWNGARRCRRAIRAARPDVSRNSRFPCPARLPISVFAATQRTQ